MAVTIDHKKGYELVNQYYQNEGNSISEEDYQKIIRVIELAEEMAYQAYQRGVKGLPFRPVCSD